jgi:hypothetical protein
VYTVSLIKNKIKFSSYIRKFRMERCKVIYGTELEFLKSLWGLGTEEE